MRHKMKRIQSKKHKLETYKSDKISLSCFDNKRYVLDDGIYTLAYFHKLQIVKRFKRIVTKYKTLKKIVIQKKRLKKNVIKKIVINKIAKKLHVNNKMFVFFSSNVDEVIRAILNFFYSFFV